MKKTSITRRTTKKKFIKISGSTYILKKESPIHENLIAPAISKLCFWTTEINSADKN